MGEGTKIGRFKQNYDRHFFRLKNNNWQGKNYGINTKADFVKSTYPVPNLSCRRETNDQSPKNQALKPSRKWQK